MIVHDGLPPEAELFVRMECFLRFALFWRRRP